MRTTIDIDKPILDELKLLGKKRKKTVGQLVSELLATTLNQVQSEESARSKRLFHWNSKPMGARIDIADKDALFAAIDKQG
jgi:hypothetical protein